MTTDYTLLPPNATRFELAFERAMRPGVGGSVDLVRTGKEVLPDGWPMFLVWEYGLEELLPYLPDPRVVLTTGLQWQRIKGTPASLRMALAWLGLAALVEEETPTGMHWYEYQIDPGKLPSREELENLVGLARLSAPVGTRLSRVFHGYDLRRAIYDESAWSDGTLYSDHSGVFDPGLGVDLSFGVTVKTLDELGDVLTATALSRIHTATTFYNDRPRWDFVSWGDGPAVRNHDAAISRDHALFGSAASPEGQPQVGVVTRNFDTDEYGWGESSWGPRTWTEPASSVE